MKHTPGPWEAFKHPNTRCTYVAANTKIADVYSTVFKDAENETANARLIAAAPELLEACSKAVRELNEIRARDGVPYNHQGFKASVDENYFSSVVDECFAAIAKAEGR